MVDISDLKSLAQPSVGVRVPSPAPERDMLCVSKYVSFCILPIVRERVTTHEVVTLKLFILDI